jgi:hypothetical protein
MRGMLYLADRGSVNPCIEKDHGNFEQTGTIPVRQSTRNVIQDSNSLIHGFISVV